MVVGEMGVPPLVMRRDLSHMGWATGKVVVGLKGFTTFLRATLALVCRGGAGAFGGVGAGRGSPGGALEAPRVVGSWLLVVLMVGLLLLFTHNVLHEFN